MGVGISRIDPPADDTTELREPRSSSIEVSDPSPDEATELVDDLKEEEEEDVRSGVVLGGGGGGTFFTPDGACVEPLDLEELLDTLDDRELSDPCLVLNV